MKTLKNFGESFYKKLLIIVFRFIGEFSVGIGNGFSNENPHISG